MVSKIDKPDSQFADYARSIIGDALLPADAAIEIGSLFEVD